MATTEALWADTVISPQLQIATLRPMVFSWVKWCSTCKALSMSLVSILYAHR
jgi:hypothetical protein